MIPISLFPLVAALIANVTAQVLKLFVYYYRTGQWNFQWVFMSGGFPSSHSSTVTALSLTVGMIDGFTSTLFAVTTVFSIIVMYDACHVRYYSGKNIELTQQLIKDLKEMTGLPFNDPIYHEKLKTILGHKIIEVFGGLILGLLIPLLMSPLFVLG